MGNRNRRLWPTNKLKRRLSLARPARPFPLTSQLRTRWFIPIALRTPSLPALSPLRPQGRACPRREYKNQLRSTTVSTPRLLMAAIKSGISHQSLFLESLIHLTYFPINFLFSLLRSFFLLSSSPALTLLSPDTSTRLFASDSRLVSYPSKAQSRQHPSLVRTINATSTQLFTLYFAQSLRLWVYHRDFGATLSVVYGS